MLIEEAAWIRDQLKKINLRKEQIVFDVGSSSERFRCVDQPYIDNYVFRPLRRKGIRIIHLDAKKEEGVDVICDLANPLEQASLMNIGLADLVLCTSFLEHVINRDVVLERIKKLIKPGGALILTVPYHYPYHPDPIDTLYRPSDVELEALFSEEHFLIGASKVLEASEATGRLVLRFYRKFRSFFFGIPLRKQYKVSALLVQKRD